LDGFSDALATIATAVPSISRPPASVLSNVTSTPTGHQAGKSNSSGPRGVLSQIIALLAAALESRT
jgi:hypothetical protein